MLDHPLPEHMSRQHRTDRLYETLKGMGLYVTPIYVDGEIDSLHVAVGLPEFGVPEKSAEAGIIAPVEGAKVLGDVEPPKSSGPNVVHFPSVV
jgi:hypothetical protein